MIDFNEVWDNDGFLSSCSRADAEHFYNAGQQSKIDELQTRIDEALNKIDFWVGGKNGDAIHVAKSIGNILKGNKDGN